MPRRNWTEEQKKEKSILTKEQRPFLYSTGPRTPKGKRYSSLNSRKHGLFDSEKSKQLNYGDLERNNHVALFSRSLSSIFPFKHEILFSIDRIKITFLSKYKSTLIPTLATKFHPGRVYNKSNSFVQEYKYSNGNTFVLKQYNFHYYSSLRVHKSISCTS